MTVSCGRFSDGIWVQFKAAMELVYSKASGFSYKHESFTVDRNDGVCAEVCFW